MKNKFLKIFCVFFGHSDILDNCFGYVSCARCGEQLGDTLAGVYTNIRGVVVGHDCKICHENYKKLSLINKLFTPYPFNKD